MNRISELRTGNACCKSEAVSQKKRKPGRPKILGIGGVMGWLVSPVDESNGGLGLTTANARQSHDEPTSTELAVAFLRQTVTIDSCGNSLLIPKL